MSLMDESQNDSKQQPCSLITKLNQTAQESRHLYESALHVRSLILPPHHPDVVASKFSLAELLDSPMVVSTAFAAAELTGGEGKKQDVMDAERANELREEILNAYNVEEMEEAKDS